METKNIQEGKVNFETALLAKELGFDEICYYHFGIDGEEFSSRLPDGSKNSNWAKCTARPTLAHLQTWLREVHNIDINPVRDQEVHFKNEVRWIVTVSNWNNIKVYKSPIANLNHPEHYHFIDFKSYEKALEAGLFAGLGIVKAILEKQKKNSKQS